MGRTRGTQAGANDLGEPAWFLSSGGLWVPVTLDSNGNLPVAFGTGAANQGQYNLTKPTRASGDYGAQQQSAHGDTLTAVRNLLQSPTTLFNMTTRQAGVTQKGLIFPTTIALTGGSLPAKDSGTGGIVTITNSSNVCGGVFAPREIWDSVLIDLAVVGQNAADTLTIEIGRVKASGGIAEVLASVVLTASAVTLAVSKDPFTGATHSAVTWRFPDVAAITATSQLGDVLTALGGTSGNLAQLRLNCHDVSYYYVVITAFSDGGTRTSEVMCDITPVS